MRRKKYLTLLITTLSICCSWLLATNGGKYVRSASAQNDGDLAIARYSSPSYAQINSYWIETAEGIIVVDTQLFLSQARYLVDEIQSNTNKSIIAALITHPHADHFAGLSILADAADDLAIYASQGTYKEIKSGNGGRPLTKLKELYGNDFPASEDIPLPNQIVSDGDRFEIGGVVFEAKVMENVDSPSSTVWILPQHQVAFVGDFAPDRRTPSLRGGNSANYLAKLKQMRQLLQEQEIVLAYPGHGEPQTPEDLIDQTVAYITYIRDRVEGALQDDTKLSESETTEIKLAIENRFDLKYDSLLLPRLTEVNLKAIAEELKTEQL